MITHVVVGPGPHYMSLLAAFDALHTLASDDKVMQAIRLQANRGQR